LPVLLVQTNQRTHEVASAIDSYRNEIHNLIGGFFQGMGKHTEGVAGALEKVLELAASTEKLLSGAAFDATLSGKVRGLVEASMQESGPDNGDAIEAKQIGDGEDEQAGT
jgi:hypothetical protein